MFHLRKGLAKRVTVRRSGGMPSHSMEERSRMILRMPDERERITVVELTNLFGASEVTIRHDLAQLEAQGKLTRIRGGAIRRAATRRVGFEMRLEQRVPQKKAIARAAAGLVRDGDAIALDSSTTAYYLALELQQRKDLVVVTSGLRTAAVLSVELAGDDLRLREWHRFATPVRRDEAGTLRWGLGELQRHIAQGLAALGEQTTVGSVGVDTWGIDFGLLDEDGRLLGDPVSHRDGRTAGMLAEADRRVGRERLYHDTGSQLLEINSVYQLLAMQVAGDPALERARLLLMVPDLLHLAMSGVAACEYTDATTTGFYDVPRRAWAVELLDDLGVPRHFLGEVVAPGSVDGELRPSFASAPGLQGTLVVRPGSHDTASAVVAVPFSDPHAAYISSGTWSLVGVETPEPVVTEASLQAN